MSSQLAQINLKMTSQLAQIKLKWTSQLPRSSPQNDSTALSSNYACSFDFHIETLIPHRTIKKKTLSRLNQIDLEKPMKKAPIDLTIISK